MIVSSKYRAYPDASTETQLNAALDACRWLYNILLEGETVYRDKGYFGVKPRASMDRTMHRAIRGHPLSVREKRRNKAISRVRSLVERPFAVIKTVLNASQVVFQIWYE
ncbi:MAG: transposase, family [Methanofollis sp.]|nr:transposase, family [Methanofollis sp.]